MAQPTLQKIIDDPEFHNLPELEKIKVFKTVDPDFSKMSARDQNSVMLQLMKKKPIPEPKMIKGADITRFEPTPEKLSVGTGTQPYLESLKRQRNIKDIESLSIPESEAQEPMTGKEWANSILRPTISATTSAAGAIIGTVGATPGVGTVFGGGLGYAIGEEIADHFDEWLGLRERQPLVLELAESAEDVAEGMTYEAGGQVALPLLSKTVKPVWKWGTGKIPKSLKFPLSKEGAEFEAGKQLIAMVKGKGPIIAKNYEDARNLEEMIPGLKFRMGQLTNDPGTIMWERGRARSYGEVASEQADQSAKNYEAIQNYINKTKGTEGLADVTGVLQTEREAVETGVTTAQKQLERETALLETGQDVIQSGEQIRKSMTAEKGAVEDIGSKMFEDVPQFEVDSSRLNTVIDEISQPENLAEDLKANVPNMFKRIKDSLALKGNMLTPKELQGINSGLKDKLREAQGATPNPAKARRLIKLIGEVDSVLKEAGETAVTPKPTSSGQAKYKGKIIRTDKLKEELAKVDKKLSTEAHTTADQIDVKKAYSELQQAKVAGIMRQVQETGDEHAKRIAEQYKIHLGKDAPVIPGKERASITKAKKQKAEMEKILAEAVPIEPAEMAEAAGKLKTAQKFWKTEVVEKFKQGTVGDILKKGASGDKVGNAQVASRFFKPGQKGIQQADEFINAIGDNQNARQAMEDYIKQDLIESTTNPVTGEITNTKLKTWLKKYGPALKKYGLEKRFNTLEKARIELDSALEMKTLYDKSVASKLLNSDIDTSVKNAFASGSKGAAANKLLKQMKGDKQAISGLQNAMIDHIIESSKTTASDAFGNPIIGFAALEKGIKNYMPAMRILFKDSPGKLKALKSYRDAMKVMQRGKASPLGGGSDTAENIVSILSKSKSLNAVRSLMEPIKTLSDKQVNAFLNRAAYDPEFAYTLMFIAKGRPKNIVRERLKGHMISLGLKPIGKALGLDMEGTIQNRIKEK